MVGFFVIFVYCAVLGAFVQIWKARTGVAWTLVSLVAVLGSGHLVREAIGRRYAADDLAVPRVSRAVAVVSYGVPMVVMSFVLVSLPRRVPSPRGSVAFRPHAEERLRRKCPHCAELILAEARLCRFCDRDVRPILEPEDFPTLPAGPPTPSPE